jgi:apolipoprotein N-acyltransferase
LPGGQDGAAWAAIVIVIVLTIVLAFLLILFTFLQRRVCGQSKQSR